MLSKTVAAALAVALMAQTAEAQTVDPIAILKASADAHGGTERWLALPAVRERMTMHFNSVSPEYGEGRTWSDSWRYFDLVIEPATSRGYVDNLLIDRPGAEQGFDGKQLWDSGATNDPQFRLGAYMLLWFFSSSIAMPFQAYVEGADVTYEGEAEVFGHPKPHHKIKVDYNPIGWPGEIVYYVDKETMLLRGWEQDVRSPPLPGHPVAAPPPQGVRPARAVDSYMEVGGFILPRAYVSYTPRGDYTGIHLVNEIEILDHFDAAMTAPPADAHIELTSEN